MSMLRCYKWHLHRKVMGCTGQPLLALGLQANTIIYSYSSCKYVLVNKTK